MTSSDPTIIVVRFPTSCSLCGAVARQSPGPDHHCRASVCAIVESREANHQTARSEAVVETRRRKLYATSSKWQSQAVGSMSTTESIRWVVLRRASMSARRRDPVEYLSGVDPETQELRVVAPPGAEAYAQPRLQLPAVLVQLLGGIIVGMDSLASSSRPNSHQSSYSLTLSRQMSWACARLVHPWRPSSRSSVWSTPQRNVSSPLVLLLLPFPKLIPRDPSCCRAWRNSR